MIHKHGERIKISMLLENVLYLCKMAFSVKSTRWGHNVTKHWSSTCALLPNGCNGSNLTEVCHQDLLNEDQIMLALKNIYVGVN